MRILVVGSGAREHALLWKLRQSPSVSKLFVCPGNAGTESIATRLSLDGSSSAIEQLADYADKHRIDLTIVGPENFLVDGITDYFTDRGLRIFGPTSDAARLEGSKVWAKGVMARVGIPTADWRVFKDKDNARQYAEELQWRCVVKADVLAAGKGSFVCESKIQVDDALAVLLEEGRFGQTAVLIEELLDGQEVSVFAISDGRTVVPFGAAQDHKRAFDHDEGPNTGGMGAYTPVDHMQVAQDFAESFFAPLVAYMAAQGTPYVGVLYAGAIVTEQGPRILEFNCRLGDPEAEVLLSRLDSDLAELLLAATKRELHTISTLAWKPSEALCVVVAADTYPATGSAGVLITGVDVAEQHPGVHVFHAGTDRDVSGELVTAGGRIFCVAALGDTLPEARRNAYEAVELIHFEGIAYRHDIGSKATGTVWQAFKSEWRKPAKWEQQLYKATKDLGVLADLVELLQIEGRFGASEMQKLRDRVYEIQLELRPSARSAEASQVASLVPADVLAKLRSRFDTMVEEMNSPAGESALRAAFNTPPSRFNDIVDEREQRSR